MPIGFGIVAVFPAKTEVGDPPDGFSEIELTTDDGITLATWYRAPANGIAVILLHGANGSRDSIRPQADMLVRNGYGVLAFDLRGHGESGGKTNRFGWTGTRDVRAAVAFLKSQPEVSAIGGLGLSLGGEILLGAASDNPEITAIIADGATARCREELITLPSERPLYRNYVASLMYATVGLLSGQSPPQPLLDSIQMANTTHFLLIAGGGVPREVAFNEYFAAHAEDRAGLWIAPEAGHTAAFGRYPAEYELRTLEFLAAQVRVNPN